MGTRWLQRVLTHIYAAKGKHPCRELNWERGALASSSSMGAGHSSAGPGVLVTSRGWKEGSWKESY